MEINRIVQLTLEKSVLQFPLSVLLLSQQLIYLVHLVFKCLVLIRPVMFQQGWTMQRDIPCN